MFLKIYLYILALPKTVYFNFSYFPFKKAIRLPVFISHRVWLMQLSGKVELFEYKTGIVKVGFGEVGIFDQNRSRSIWQVSGKVSFKGKANIGHGSKISISGELIVGDEFFITAESSIVAHKKIVFGRNVLISWDSLIMDTDFHKIFDKNGNQINSPSPVYIGNSVWIGCQALILKGSKILDGSVIAASSRVSKCFKEKNVIIGGIPADIIKKDINWKV